MPVNGRKVDFFTPINKLFYSGNDYKGEVGLEVEVEGHNLLRQIPSYWKYDKDNSLRGDENAEYILLQPTARKSVFAKLKYLQDRLLKNGATFDKSMRTSVHVHINMSQQTLTECFQLIALYLIFEPLLINIAGPERVGNLFCLRAIDAEDFIDQMKQMVETRTFSPDIEQLKYTALNIVPITTYNSIEFRALRGTTDPEVITNWVNILLAMKDAALEYKSPVEIVGDFSRLGPEGFARKVFPEHYRLLTDQPEFADLMWESARLMQQVVFAWDWQERPEEKPKRAFNVGGDNPRPLDIEW